MFKAIASIIIAIAISSPAAAMTVDRFADLGYRMRIDYVRQLLSGSPLAQCLQTVAADQILRQAVYDAAVAGEGQSPAEIMVVRATKELCP